MITPYCKKFKQNIGYTVHVLNTTVVALSLLGEEEKPVVPEDLSITWTTKNIRRSVELSRAYIVKSSLVFICESLYSYFCDLGMDPFNSLFKPIGTVKKDGKQQKKEDAILEILREQEYSDVNSVFVSLLFKWRNKIIHIGSNSNLKKNQKAILDQNKEEIFKNFSGLVCSKLVEHYEGNKPKLKEVSSIAVIAINCVNEIDKNYQKNISKSGDKEKLKKIITSDVNFVKSILSVKEEQWPKKIEQWVKTNNFSWFNRIDFIKDYIIGELIPSLKNK